ncbi:MAG: GNAT family N-acetyltransferase, partial [Candidatus Bathyarchaeota archaeon]|nr:GNAT family N-acetyltransferase [Candidatus Bathyarchaeota archaeon]
MQVLIRGMHPDEKVAVEKLFTRSLGLIDRIVFKLAFEGAQKNALNQSGGTLVAEHDGKIVGAVSMRIQRIKTTQAGFIDALVVAKELRGRAIGKLLVDGAASWLEERGCTVIYATADRYNSPSWNIFIHRGFHPYEVPQQFRDYGLNFLRLWLVEFHFIGYGTFFLKRDKNQNTPRPTGGAWHWLAALLGVSTVWWIQILRSQGQLTLVPAVFAIVSLSLMAHEFSQKLVARKLGFAAEFKAWGSGILFSLLLALAGCFFPAYGSTYLKQLDWKYDPQKDKNGIFFAIGPLVSLILGFVFWATLKLTVDSLLSDATRVGYV